MIETLKRNELENKQAIFFDVSNDPEIFNIQQDAMSKAVSIMGLYRIMSEASSSSETPLPIDVMSSTREYFETVEDYGYESHEAEIASNLQRMDVERLVDEILTAKTFNLREPIFQEYDYLKKDYTTLGKSHKEMVKRGLSPYCNHEEKIIRQIEYVEEEISSFVQEEFERKKLNLINIKECPDWAIDAYERGESNTGGYVPSENKFVIQSFKYVEGGRIYQQATVPGKLISHEDILEVLSTLSEKEVAGSKLEIRKKYFGSKFDINTIVEMLDKRASERLGINVYLGEMVENGAFKEYTSLDAITGDDKKRNQIVESVISKLNQMQEDKINPIIAGERLDTFISDLILNEYIDDDRVIEHTFGLETAIKASNLKEQFASKQTVINKLSIELPKVEYCGAGSCGIQRVDSSTPAVSRASSRGLIGDIGFFAEGTCKKCQKPGFYVSDNGKYCDDCGSIDLIK